MKREPASNSRLCHRLRVATITAAAALTTFLFVVPTEAQVTVKMATLVPDGTSSGPQIVKEAAEKWKKISNGRVTVNSYWGGVSGDDPDVVRKMRLGTLHAGLLTSAGVGEIDKSVYALGVPMMYASYDEVYSIMTRKCVPSWRQASRIKGLLC